MEELLFRGHPDVADTELADYCRSIPHADLLNSIGPRIVDRRVPHLNMLFVENDFGRYSIGSTTDGLKPDADGSLTILIQKDKPADTANWLPAPSGSFNLTLRLYGPETPIFDGSYRLPAIKRVD